MHDARLRAGQRQQLVVDLVGAQGGEAHVVLGLLAHAGKGVGVDHVGAAHGRAQVAGELDRGAGLGGVGARPGDDRLVGPVSSGVQITTRMPVLAPTSASEWATLLPSPE